MGEKLRPSGHGHGPSISTSASNKRARHNSRHGHRKGPSKGGAAGAGVKPGHYGPSSSASAPAPASSSSSSSRRPHAPPPTPIPHPQQQQQQPEPEPESVSPTLYMASWCVPARVALLPLNAEPATPQPSPPSTALAADEATTEPTTTTTACVAGMLAMLTEMTGGRFPSPDILALQGLWGEQAGTKQERAVEAAALAGAVPGYKGFFFGSVGVFVSEYLLPHLIHPPSGPAGDLAWAEGHGRVLVCELQALALLCVNVPDPRDPYRHADIKDQDDPVAEARRRFDDGLCRLVRRLRRAGKQVVVMGRVGLLPPADRRLAEPVAGGVLGDGVAGVVAAAGLGGEKRVRREGFEEAREKDKDVGAGGEMVLSPEEQRFEERLLGASALMDAYRACNPREAGWTMRMPFPVTGEWVGGRPDLILLPCHAFDKRAANGGVAAGALRFSGMEQLAGRVAPVVGMEGTKDGEEKQEAERRRALQKQLMETAPVYAEVNLDALIPSSSSSSSSSSP